LGQQDQQQNDALQAGGKDCPLPSRLPIRHQKIAFFRQRSENNTWNHVIIAVPLMVGAIYNGGSRSNTFMGKVMRYYVIGKTVHAVSTADAYIKRSQLGNKNWKQHEESRHIRSTFDGWTFGVDATWSNKSSAKSLWDMQIETTGNSVSTADAYIKRSQLGNKNWKQHEVSRHIRSAFDGWTFGVDATRSKVMPVHVLETTVHCGLDWHCAPARSQLANQAWATWQHDSFGLSVDVLCILHWLDLE
jgi:hypothetical protein